MYKKFKKHISVIVLFCFVLYPQIINALPQGGTVVGGNANATLDYSVEKILTVDQKVPRIIADWESFSIGQPETVKFDQNDASCIALNRVTSENNPSIILGRLTALGKVFLINPSGIVFGVNSVVDTAGLIASTLKLDMDDNDFMNNVSNTTFNFLGLGGAIVNYGTLKTLSNPGGYVALLGSSVKNLGYIEANLGEVILAAGEQMTLDLDPASLISVVVNISQGTDRNDNSQYAAVNNAGTIVANDGKVILTADILDNVFTSAVNNDGIIEANAIDQTDGMQVLLKSNQNIELNGTIDLAKGTIDAYAEENIILGNPINDTLSRIFYWRYLGEVTRGYKFKEFGYYYGNDQFRISLSIGEDIGRDGSPKSGWGTEELTLGKPQGLYTIFDTTIIDNMGLLAYFEDASLNPETPVGLEHVQIKNGTEYWWEDMYNQGDKDFNDAIIDFVTDIITIPAPPALLDAPNIFLTANQGSIEQRAGNAGSRLTQLTHYVIADNLVLSANTGMSGTGSNGGLATHVANVSALNKTSGHIRINNKGDLTIADLSVDGLNLVGLNDGVTGYDGILNNATGGDVNINVIEGSSADLNVEAPVDSYGPVIFTAEGNIAHTPEGDVTIHNAYLLPGFPAALASPSHSINVPYLNDGNVRIDTTWELPAPTDGYEFTGVAGGSYAMAAGSEILTQGGNANITANGDVSLALIDAQNADVVVTSENGNIVDNDSGSSPTDFDVIAHNIKLSAPNGSVGDIDLGHPYDFSHLWDNLGNTDVDSSVDPYDEFFDPVSGDWSFATLSDILSDGSWWFHVAAIDGIEQSATAHLGPFIFDTEIIPPPPPPIPEYWETIEKELRVYYEILDPSQFLSFEPAKYLGLYAYHPLTSTDSSAFDDIKLDIAAYEFIDGNINVTRPAAPYFGLIDEEEKR